MKTKFNFKVLAPVLVLALLLGACNLPGRNLSEEDALATNAAIVLTDLVSGTRQSVEPSKTPPPPTPTAIIWPTLPPTAISTPLILPTAISTPKAMANETQPTDTVVTGTPGEQISVNPTGDASTALPPSDQNTIPVIVLTPVPAETTQQPTTPIQASPTGEPTRSAGDPTAGLGKADYEQEYDNTIEWSYSDAFISLWPESGQLRIVSNGYPYWNSWYTLPPVVSNGYYEATVTMSACNDEDRIGLAFMLSGNNFYYTGLTCNGKWGFSRYLPNGQFIDILPYTTSTLITANSATRLGVLVKDGAFEFFINGKSVGTAKDSALSLPGSFGFVSMTTGYNRQETRIDRLQYWEP